ncbi:MAG: hypothetical protein Q9174_005119 [Haloplaca sp. 1 TL-2023]
MAASLASSVVASPVPAPAQSVNCKDPKSGVSPACWKSLAVGDYMLDWNKKNFAAVPSTCKAGEDWNIPHPSMVLWFLQLLV